MKKYMIMVLSVAALGLASCTDDTMDKINENWENPSASLVSAHLQVSDAIMSTAFSTVSGDYAFYTSSLTEQEFGTGNNQFKNAEVRSAGELAAPSTFNNVWNGTYSNLLNIKEMIDKVENNIASSGGQLDVLGVAQVLWVINFEILTDMHGDIPYKEALHGSGNMQAKCDSQKDIYTDLIATIDKAIGNLQTAADAGMKNFGSEDIAYKGDVEQWLAAAYAVKARLYIHMTAVDGKAAGNALTAANKAVKLGFSGLQVSEFNGQTCDNPWSAFVWSRGYTAPSKTVTDLMEAADYPLLTYYTYFEDPADVAAAPGDEDRAKESFTWCYPYWMDFGSQPVQILSESELYFILAEAQLRCDKDATDAFQTAVASAINTIAGWCEEEEDGETYAELLGTPDLEAVFQQKYMAAVADGQVETYNDIRRCMAMGESYITLTNPKNIQGGQNRWPYLLPYGQSTVTSNPNIKPVDIYTTKAWIFGGK